MLGGGRSGAPVGACAARRITLPPTRHAAWPISPGSRAAVVAPARRPHAYRRARRFPAAPATSAARARHRRLRARRRRCGSRASAPFGPPAFILAARAATPCCCRATSACCATPTRATPWRADRRVAGAGRPAGHPHRVRRPGPEPTRRAAARETGWRPSTSTADATLYLQRVERRWQLRAARRDGWQIEYPAWQGRPSRSRCGCGPTRQSVHVDLTAAVSSSRRTSISRPTASRVDEPPATAPTDRSTSCASRAAAGTMMLRRDPPTIASLRRPLRRACWTSAADSAAGAGAVLGFRVVNAYPHDTDAFTQGLLFRDGVPLREHRLKGRSSLRKVRLETGEVVQQAKVDSRYFAEGLTDWGNRLVQLTWETNIGFVYDLASFKRLQTFTYAGEGWGLTHDGRRLIMSDGTPTLRFLDPADLHGDRPHPVTDGDRAGGRSERARVRRGRDLRQRLAHRPDRRSSRRRPAA